MKSTQCLVASRMVRSLQDLCVISDDRWIYCHRTRVLLARKVCVVYERVRRFGEWYVIGRVARNRRYLTVAVKVRRP